MNPGGAAIWEEMEEVWRSRAAPDIFLGDLVPEAPGGVANGQRTGAKAVLGEGKTLEKSNRTI